MQGTKDPVTPLVICDIMKLNEQGWDIYFIPNAVLKTFVGVKPSDADIWLYRRFVVDLDYIPNVTINFNETAVRGYTHMLADEAPELVGKRRALIYTGNGVQIHYTVAENWNTEYVRPRVASLLTKLSQHPVRLYGERHKNKVYMVDSCTSDPSRMVRFPFTINHKTGVRGDVEEAHLGDDVDISLFEPETYQTVTEPFVGDVTNLSQVAPRLTNKAIEFLMYGVVVGRHQAAYAAAASLRNSGVPKQLAFNWVSAGALKCNPPLPIRDADHCVRQAYKNQPA